VLARVDGILVRPVAGDDYGNNLGIAFNGGLDDNRAVDAGQPQVGDDDIEGELAEAGKRLFTRIGLLDSISPVAELFGDGLAKRGLVLDEKQMFRGLRHLARRQHIDTGAAVCLS